MDPSQTVRVAVETLMEVVESSKNIELCVVYQGNKKEMLPQEDIDKIFKDIEKEREEAD